jgi:SLOG in TRPM, prokaryote
VPEAFAVEFPGRPVAKAVQVDAEDELAGAVEALGLRPRPTLVLVGGAAGVSGDDSDALRSLFVETIAPLVGELDAQVVDGATDAGVMRLLGRARHELGLDFPLIGVAARGNVAMPGAPAAADAAPLEPNHSHFVLVAGSGWGSESPWIAHLAGVLAGNEASATLLVHGGDIAWTDAAESVADERTVVTVIGSGGTADALAARGDPRAQPLTSSGLVVTTEDGALAQLLRRLLGGDD